MTIQVEEKKSALVKSTTLREILGESKVKDRFAQILGAKAPAFVSSIISACQANPELGKADPHSIIAAAAVAASLDLPINGSLGFAALVPYKKKSKNARGEWSETFLAQFQIMSRGFVQLAQRTGQYKSMAVSEVYEGQLKSEDPITGEYQFDHKSRTSDKVIGYVFYFRLVNGFEKYTYMTVAEIQAHGKKFSKSYDSDFGMWKTNFPMMALKTVVKRGLSKWGPLSTEMQKAVEFDQAAVTGDEKPDYIDSTATTAETEQKTYALPQEKQPEPETEAKPAKEREIVFKFKRAATTEIGGQPAWVITSEDDKKFYLDSEELCKKAVELGKVGKKISALVASENGKDWALNIVEAKA